MAGALLVRLDGGPARVDPVATGLFAWQRPVMDLLPGEDVQERLATLLPPEGARRDAVVRLVARGRLPLSERTTLADACARLAPDFGWFAADLSGLASDVQPDDLDHIDRAGALRRAAETLLAEARDPSLAQDARDVAGAALARLYALVQEGRA